MLDIVAVEGYEMRSAGDRRVSGESFIESYETRLISDLR